MNSSRTEELFWIVTGAIQNILIAIQIVTIIRILGILEGIN